MANKFVALFQCRMILLWIFFCFSLSFALERELVAFVNPGCSHCSSSEFSIIHVRADGPNDTLHYLWGFVQKPVILLAITSRETNLSIQWNEDNFIPKRIEFSNPPAYSFGVLFNQFFEFNDAEDTGFMNISNSSASYIHRIEMPDLWQMGELIQNRDSVRLTVSGVWSNNVSVISGSVKIQLEAFKMEDHDSLLPHLLHSSNATQIDFGMLNLTTTSGFEQSRYALELIISANESSKHDVLPRSFKSLDDEHSPGVFTMLDLQTTASVEKGSGGYIQWRPVAYIATERDIVNSTETTLYSVMNVTNSSSSCRNTLLETYFGTINLESNLLKAVNISFGAKDDGFYAKYNMTFWTATIGYGHPPEEKFSMLIVLVIMIGLGLPALVILLSIIYLGLRRISQRKDDLFLNR